MWNMILSVSVPPLFIVCLDANVTLCEDERLGKLFKANPPTEDGYVYLGNGPRSDS